MDKEKKKDKKSALHVQDGVEQPESVNREAARRFMQHKRKLREPEWLAEELMRGSITALSEAITLVESALPEHRHKAEIIIDRCIPNTGNALRIGFTGVPGVGKSSFIETFGMQLIEAGNKIAVLAIDPSSERTGGSILGDKTRMEQLSVSERAFIRPSPSAGSLGGVARKTAESALLCEAAGFNYIFIETVGVGQSEIAVHSMTDFFLLLMLAGAGDELQGIKRGIMEMADAIVINKADGDNIRKAEAAKQEYQNALHLFPPPESGWEPRVISASARTAFGLDKVRNTLDDYVKLTRANGFFELKRQRQAKFRMHETIREQLLQDFYGNEAVLKQIAAFEKRIADAQISPYTAAGELLKFFRDGNGL